MATVGERVAALTSEVAELSRRVAELHDDIHSGPTVDWGQSVRGRLHDMTTAIGAATKLADAAKELAAEGAAARAQTLEATKMARRSRLSRLQWAYLAVCATATAAAPYVLHFT